MSLKTSIKENGLFGIVLYFHCLLFGHDYNIGRICVYCEEPKRTGG
jgi:hypothetical protein